MNSLDLLIDQIASNLKQREWQLVTAESCTGGLIAAAITEIAGSSLWFERGFVTYSNLAKQQMLGVAQDLLIKYGAVSEPTARAMAEGALQKSAGQVAVSVTGIAGPEGGSDEKPVGLVYFAWAAQGISSVSDEQIFKGTRHQIRQAAVGHALQGVCSILGS